MSAPDPNPAPPDLTPRWLHTLAVVAAVGLLLAYGAVSTAHSLNDSWTSVRLAPSFALAHGYPLYSLPGQPPWVMVGYGPFYPVMYLPCALAHSPVMAVTLAEILSNLYTLAPVALFCFLFAARLGVAQGRAMETGVVPGLLLFGVLIFPVLSITYVVRHIHVDAPTFGLMLLACFAALRADPPTNPRTGLGWTLAAGALGALSVCCKANALGSIGALGLYVWWSAGWRRMLVYALSAAAVGAVVYGWAASLNGVPAIAHNFRTLGRFPWYTWQSLQFDNISLDLCSREPKQKLLSAAFLGVVTVQTYAVAFLALALVVYVLSRRRSTAEDAPVPAVPAVPGALPAGSAYRVVGCLLFIALMGTPASIASVAKYGGAVNGWAFVSLPLCVAAVLVMMALLERAEPAVRRAVQGALVATALVAMLGEAVIFKMQHPLQGSVIQEAYETIRAHPGECYFASDPLAHMLAGDRFRPNQDVVYSYAVAGMPIDVATFKKAMPEGLKYLALTPGLEHWGGDEVHRLLPEESEKTEELGLHFHDAWKKP